jgi:hypothetical protein
MQFIAKLRRFEAAPETGPRTPAIAANSLNNPSQLARKAD